MPRMLVAVAAIAAIANFAAAPATRAADAAPNATDPVAVEPYFRHPDFGGLRLSPSGRYVAALVPLRGRLSLAVMDLETNAVSPVASLDGGDIVNLHWVNDRRLVFSMFDLQAGLGEQRGGGLFAVNRDGSDVRELAPTIQRQINNLKFVGRNTLWFASLDDGSDDILVVSNESNPRFPDVYRMNTTTGRKTLKSLDKPGDVVRWVADRGGALRAALTEEKGGTTTRMFWRASETSPWVQMAENGLRGGAVVPIGFDGDGSLIVTANLNRDATALYRYDTAKKALGELLVAHPHADLDGGLVYDRKKARIVGVAYEGERPGVAWFDEDWARLQQGIDRALPDQRNALSHGNGKKILVSSYSDRNPGTYYLFDPEKRKLEFLAATRKAIKPEAMPARTPVRFAARDGLEIPAYLTLPPGRPAKNLPLVVYVHGGPWVRGGHWAWQPEIAYLAALGYAVIEPDFRSSTGWGRKLFESGFGQWGRAMQDDLDDAVDWLAKEGTIDPKRACIMGASYGGYAVMMGLARDPARWRCGINYVGVTDIQMMFDVTWSDLANSEAMRYSAKEMIGDPDKDAAQFKATSPLQNAAKITAPVLMAYGGQDVRVPVVHGERMRDALAKQGTPVEWVVYQEEGHGFVLERNRYDFYGRVGRFLAKYNPAN